ncbi:hypothetical protein GCM10010921_15950 [Microbacterium album]|uniref:MmgE/PrpD N-terminal domain-containing protein n=1 Tax=Microbacterium album TaxID=2053191 RepID=A0A917IGW5_9MICO|nr:hypothetical protein GCM10010921_15950 [Microbacterium album]
MSSVMVETTTSPESQIAQWLVTTQYEDVPPEVRGLMRRLTYVILGCAFAGASADGCDEVRDTVTSAGGAPQSTILVHGERVPARGAAFVNSVMARAYDICDSIGAGQHMGASVIPTALAVSELIGGIDGEAFIRALALGCEIGARFGAVSRLDGFDPTGVGNVVAVTAVTGLLMGLDSSQLSNALGIAFNRMGGSFQSNVDGSLAVRLIQGFASENGLLCAQLAQRGMTGPDHWISGHWGFFHLYCKGERDAAALVHNLGVEWKVRGMAFKNYPSVRWDGGRDRSGTRGHGRGALRCALDRASRGAAGDRTVLPDGGKPLQGGTLSHGRRPVQRAVCRRERTAARNA